MEEAKRLGQCLAKQAAINAALKEYVAKQKRLAVIQAFGTFDLDDNDDYKNYGYKRARQAMIVVDIL